MSVSTCPRCDTPKARNLFACRDCWRALPADVQADINRTYRRDGPLSPEWAEAAGRAFDAWGMERPRWLLVLLEDD